MMTLSGHSSTAQSSNLINNFMNTINRRDFMLNLASAGLGVTVLPHVVAAPAAKKAEHII